jgi:hypothetical protein
VKLKVGLHFQKGLLPTDTLKLLVKPLVTNPLLGCVGSVHSNSTKDGDSEPLSTRPLGSLIFPFLSSSPGPIICPSTPHTDTAPTLLCPVILTLEMRLDQRRAVCLLCGLPVVRIVWRLLPLALTSPNLLFIAVSYSPHPLVDASPCGWLISEAGRSRMG